MYYVIEKSFIEKSVSQFLKATLVNQNNNVVNIKILFKAKRKEAEERQQLIREREEAKREKAEEQERNSAFSMHKSKC